MSVVEGARVDTGTEGPVRLDGRLKLVLVVLLVAQFMLAVDFSILNVALPVIGDGLGFSLSNL
ncbi:MFS transporter, partial [Streptomyces sp. NPDC054945]